MLDSFGSEANIAAFDVGFNISTSRRPVIFPGNQLAGLVDSEMTCQRIVVMSTNQFRSNDLRNIGKAFILEHSLDIFPSFKKVCSPQFPCLIIVALQVWQS